MSIFMDDRGIHPLISELYKYQDHYIILLNTEKYEYFSVD